MHNYNNILAKYKSLARVGNDMVVILCIILGIIIGICPIVIGYFVANKVAGIKMFVVSAVSAAFAVSAFMALLSLSGDCFPVYFMQGVFGAVSLVLLFNRKPGEELSMHIFQTLIWVAIAGLAISMHAPIVEVQKDNSILTERVINYKYSSSREDYDLLTESVNKVLKHPNGVQVLIKNKEFAAIINEGCDVLCGIDSIQYVDTILDSIE